MEIIERTFTSNGNMDTRKSTERIILHHAAANSCTVEDVDRWHKNNGWCKIGYHFFVDKQGNIFRGREEDKVGSHAYGSNYNSIGICAEGDYTYETMPEAQKNALKELVAYLKEKYNINVVQGHRDVCATSCPGDNYPFDEIANATSNEIIQPAKEDVNTGNVAKIQATVNERYGYSITVDNIYGNETRKALVRALQHEFNVQFGAGLSEDGLFGKLTYNACRNIKKGMQGNITWLIQAMLVCHSFDLVVDGIFGVNTENAVRKFQERNGLASDGICGKNTFNKLFK